MSFVENGLSFIGNAFIKDHHGARPIAPLENPTLPGKFEAVVGEVFKNTDSPEITTLTSEDHKEIWNSPEAVTFIFAHLNKLSTRQLEVILRKERLVQKITGDALKDPATMATVIATTARFDEQFDEELASRDANHIPGTMDSKYFYTREAIHRLNGLSQNTSFHQFLNQKVGFDTKPAFEDLRNQPHTSRR